MSCSCDPRGAYTELADTRAVTNPPRIKSAKAITEGINAWEGIQLRHQLATGATILTPHAKKYSLLSLMPPQIEKVLEDHVWNKTYDELRACIIENSEEFVCQEINVHNFHNVENLDLLI